MMYYETLFLRGEPPSAHDGYMVSPYIRQLLKLDDEFRAYAIKLSYL